MNTTRRFDEGTFLTILLGLVTAGACVTAPSTREMPASRASQVQIGYGAVSPRDLTTAVGSLRLSPQETSSYTHVEELIEGRLPGVEVVRIASGFRIRVRGTNSIMASNDPLFVVDGMPLSHLGGYLGISPRDVVRIDVLKDAGSTAIYGSRGTNGVILVSTRRGG